MILFGYKSATSSTTLLEDGTLIFGGQIRKTAMRVPQKCVERIRGVLNENREMLHRLGQQINGKAELEGENCFIFEDYRIIDWDLTRWYLEEERKKHPDYYQNSVKVEMTENHIRGVFDEICSVLQESEKDVMYARLTLRV